MTICPDCEGKNVVPCVKCDGKGDKYFVPVLDIWEADCNECYGSGVSTCVMCNGVGYVAVAPPPSSDLRYRISP